MLNKILSFFRINNLDREIESYKQFLDRSLEQKFHNYDEIKIQNGINNEEDLKREIEKIKLNAYEYELQVIKNVYRDLKLVFHFLNIGQIKELPSQVKLIQIHFNENIFFENSNDFFSNSKSRFEENCKIVTMTKLQYEKIYGEDNQDDFYILNESVKLTPITSLPNYEILEEYNNSILAYSISLNRLQYGDTGSKIYSKLQKQIIRRNEFLNQFCGYPHWNDPLYLQSQHFLKLNELIFIAQFKFDKKFLFEEYESEMSIYFFYAEETQEIKYIFNPSNKIKNYG